MSSLLSALFLTLALVAVAFVCWPLRHDGRRGVVLAAALAALVLGIGGGFYLILGAPDLALRSLTGPDDKDWKSLVAALVANARAHPRDETAWVMLGRGYITVQDGQDAAAAFRRALDLAKPSDQEQLYAYIGLALTDAAHGEVTPDAEAAFAAALARNPRDPAARYYLGLAYAARHDNARAVMLWQSLLADLPANSKLHGSLVDMIAALSPAAPDVNAMVAGLAARLQVQPNDPQGWQRLVRAYAVLGDSAKARAALSDARAALKADHAALAALAAEAKQLKLEN